MNMSKSSDVERNGIWSSGVGPTKPSGTDANDGDGNGPLTAKQSSRRSLNHCAPANAKTPRRGACLTGIGSRCLSFSRLKELCKSLGLSPKQGKEILCYKISLARHETCVS